MESDVTESAFFVQAWAWFDKHRKQVIGATAAIVLVGLIAGLYVWRQNEKVAGANLALSQALTSAPSAAAAPEALLKVAEEHAGTPASARARLIAAALYFSQGKHADAQTQFEKYMQEHGGDSPYSSQAQLGVAVSLEAQGKTNEAATSYKNLVERRSTDPVAPQARLALARLYEAQGRLVEARDLYRTIFQNNPNSSLATEAGIRHDDLLVRHPELVPKPVPPPVSSAVPGLPPGQPPAMAPTASPISPGSRTNP